MSKLLFSNGVEPFELKVSSLDESCRKRTDFKVAEISELNCSKCIYGGQEPDKFGPGTFYCEKHKEVTTFRSLIADEEIMPNAAYVCNDFSIERDMSMK